MDKLLTTPQVAEILGCHEQTVYKWKDQGKIPCVRKNGLIRFRKTEIEEWIEQGSDRVDPLTESLTKVDLALDAYDKMFLKGVTMSQTGKTWNYPFGSVYLRQNKSGKERWYVYYRIEGKRVRKAVKGAQSRSDALKVLQVEVADAFRGRHGFNKEKKRIRFAEFADQYIRDYAKVNKASWEQDVYCLKKVKPHFKNSSLHEIGSYEIERFKMMMQGKGLSGSRINRYLALLKKMFNLAIDWGYLDTNPAKKVQLFSEKDNLVERILGDVEEQRLLDECADHLKSIVKTALHTGMRRGEILNLKWDQVDLRKRSIRVEKTKSGKNRHVPINDDLHEELTRLKKHNGNSIYVFLNPKTGQPFKEVKTAFNAAKRRADIQGLRFHDLRHTFASRLIEMGADIITVKDLLGHHSVVVTQRYTHSSSDQKMSAVQKLAHKEEKSQEFVPNLSTKMEGSRLNALFTVN